MLDYSLEVKQGSVYIFRLQVTNKSRNVRTLNFCSSQEADFIVERNGKEVWRWSADRAFAMVWREKQLSAGQKMGPFEVKWPQIDNCGMPVQPGTYTVKAYFLPDSKSVPAAQAEFKVV